MAAQAKLTVIERIKQASTPEAVLEIYEEALSEIGAEYLCVVFLPRPGHQRRVHGLEGSASSRSAEPSRPKTI